MAPFHWKSTSIIVFAAFLLSSCSNSPKLVKTNRISKTESSFKSGDLKESEELYPSYDTAVGDVPGFTSSPNPFLKDCPIKIDGAGFELRTDFSAGNALLLSSLFSGTEKDPQSVIELKLKTLGFKEIEWIINGSKGVFSFIASRDELTIAHFRGTSNIGGWIQDAKFFTRRSNGKDPTGLITLDEGLDFKGWMHTGFYGSYHTVKNEFEDKLKKLAKDKPLYFAGHSLGGALTAIAAGRAKMNGLNVMGVYTAGQPRIGDREFSEDLFDKIGDRHFRLIYEDDLVARIPPTKDSADDFAKLAGRNQILSTLASSAIKIAGYVHKSHHVNLTKAMRELQLEPPSPLLDLSFWRKWDSLLTGVATLASSKLISDHTSMNYACSLSSIIDNSRK